MAEPTLPESKFRRAWRSVADAAMALDLYEDGRHRERADVLDRARDALRKLMRDAGMTDRSIGKVIDAAETAGYQYAAAYENSVVRPFVRRAR